MVLKKNLPESSFPETEEAWSKNLQKDFHPSSMSLIEHCQDLRTRLLKALGAFISMGFLCYCFSKDLIDFLVKPLAQAMPYKIGRRLIYTDLTEAFTTHLKIAGFAGLGLSLPFIFNQIWQFIAPGLYKNEQKLILLFLFLSPFLFFLGVATVYYAIFPFAWSFFLSFPEETGFPFRFSSFVLPLEIEPRLSSYIDLSLSMMVVFGLCFQLPLIITLLNRLTILPLSRLQQYRRHVVVVIFIFAAFVTPPDVVSQLLLALPLIGLYELSILIIRVCTSSS